MTTLSCCFNSSVGYHVAAVAVADVWPLRLASPSLAIAGVSVITLLVAIATTADERDGVFLDVDFGDGDPLRRLPLSGLPELPGTSPCQDSWSGRCWKTRLKYIYKKEGRYRPRVEVFFQGGAVSRSAEVQSVIYVYRNLTKERSQYELLAQEGIIETKKEQEYTLSNVAAGFDVAVQYRALRHGTGGSEERTVVQPWTVGAGHRFSYVFDKPGVYTLEADIRNPVSFFRISRMISVHEKISGLQLTTLSHREPVHVKTGRSVTLRGTFETGSDVRCQWALSAPFTTSAEVDHSDNTNCTIKVPALIPGRYNATVSASNPLGGTSPVELQSGIVAQEATEGLHMSVPGSVAVGSSFTVTAGLSQGTDVSVTCYAELQSGARVVNRGKGMRLVSEAERRYKAVLSLKRTGLHRVRVRASNRVSSSWVTRWIYVWRPVPRDLRLRIVDCARRGQWKTAAGRVAVVARDGNYYYRPGLVFQWRDGNGPLYNTSVPYYDVRLPKPKKRPVLLLATVRNPVSSITLKKAVSEADCRVPVIRQRSREVDSGYVLVDFTLKMTKPAHETSTFGIVYQALRSKTREHTSNATTAPNVSTARWTRRFSVDDVLVLVTAHTVPKAYGVVEFYGGRSSTTSLTVVGPSVVALYGIPVPYSWEASADRPLRDPPGFLYRWVFGDTGSTLTGHSRFTTTPAAPGTYALTMAVYDFKGRPQPELFASKSVTAIQCVGVSDWAVSPASLGSRSRFVLTVTGTPPITVRADASDGWRRTWSVRQDGWKISFAHGFKSRGVFPVTVKASNAVCSVRKSVLATVEEPVSGLRLFLMSPSAVVAVLEEVVVGATVETGTGIKFEWDFGEDGDGQYTTVKRGNKSSTATHIYGIPNTYVVSVSVSNAISRRPLTARLSSEIRVVERIEHLLIRTAPKQGIFPLYRCKDLPGSTARRRSQYKTSRTSVQEAKKSSVIKEQLLFLSKGESMREGSNLISGPVRNRRHAEQRDEGKKGSNVPADHGLAVKPSKPCRSTRELMFEAWVGRGSDVNFTFHFGDGVVRHEAGFLDTRSMARAIVVHRYEEEGAFLVSVTAANPLGTVSKVIDSPVVVQSAPEGLTLDQPYYVLQRGRSGTFRAHLTRGTNVSVVWTIMDGVDVRHEGRSLTHTFEETGEYTLSVEAFNRVTDEMLWRPNTTAKVYVQETLTDVEACLVLVEEEHCSPAEVTAPLDKAIVLQARVKPTTEATLRFLWALEGNNVYSTSNPQLKDAFRDPGTYVVNVTCQNYISSVSSAHLTLHLVQRATRLTGIHHEGPILLLRPVRFQALYWFGSNLTFEWDFGDGSPLAVAPSSHVQHVYNRTGEYWVKVVAWNDFSRAETRTNVFALKEPCNKPVVRILPLFTQWPLNDPIFLEAEVMTSCNVSVGVEYTWSITSANGSSVSVNGRSTTRKDLIVSPGSLAVGKYEVSLKVQMKGTPVYTLERAMLVITEATLTATVRGGIWRRIAYGETVEVSVRVDGVRWKKKPIISWKCSRLDLPGSSCFESVPPWTLTQADTEKLSFSSDIFTNDSDKYLFTATITEGARLTSVKQLLQLESSRPGTRGVYAVCLSCNGSEVNMEEDVVLKVECDGCSEEGVEYTWEILLVLDGMHHFYLAEHSCVEANGTTFYMLSGQPGHSKAGRNATRTRGSTAHGTRPSYPAVPGIPEGSIQQYSSRALEESQPPPSVQRAHLTKPVPAASKDFTPNLSAAIPLGERVPQLRPPSLADFHVSEEGAPGESGSARARDQRTFDFEKPPKEEEYSTDEEDVTRNHTHGTRLLLPSAETNEDQDSSFKIIRWDRVPIPAISSHTTTGLRSPHLVIRKGALRLGHTYIARVSVVDKASHVEVGSAIHDLRVSVGPVNGHCSLLPPSDVTSDITLRLSCSEWQSTHRPLLYEVSYSQTANRPQFPVHAGFNENVRFRLPPGIISEGNKVYLKIVVRDRRGVGTHVCSIEKLVKAPVPNTSLLNYVHNGTFHPQSSLQHALGEKDFQAALNQIHVLSTLLRKAGRNSSGLLGRGKLVRYFVATIKEMHLPTLYAKSYAASVLASLIMPMHKVSRRELTTLMAVSTSLAEPAIEAPSSVPSSSISSSVSTLVGNMLKLAHDHQMQDENYLRHCLTLPIQSAQVSLRKFLLRNVTMRFSSEWISVSLGVLWKDTSSLIMNTTWSKVFVRNSLDSAPRSHGETLMVTNCKIVSVYSFPYLPLLASQSVADKPISSSYRTGHTSAAATSLGLYSCHNVHNAIGAVYLHDVYFLRRPILPLPKKGMMQEFSIAAGLVKDHVINVTAELLYYALYVRLDFTQGSSIAEVYVRDSSFSVEPAGTKVWRTNKTVEILLPETGTQVPQLSHIIVSRQRHENVHWKLSYKSEIIKYKMQGFWQKCYAYNFTRGMWTGRNCTVGKSTNDERVHCRCVEGDIIGMKTLIFDSQAQEVPIMELLPCPNNWAILLFVGCTIVVFLVILVPVCRIEASASELSHVVALEPKASTKTPNHYLVVVRTGPFFRAGTSATISVILHGEKGMSQAVELKDVNGAARCLFQRGSQDAFLISTGLELGRLWKLEIWHNNGGPSPSWFLQDVSVIDCTTGDRFYFSCYDWFSVEQGDGVIERELLATSWQWCFTKEFYVNLSAALNGHHLWNSLLAAPKCTTFSRVQRLACCLSTVLVSASLCTLWIYYYEPEPSSQAAALRFSVGRMLQALAVATIVHILHQVPVTLFNNSRCPPVATKILHQVMALLAPYNPLTAWRTSSSSLSSFDSSQESTSGSTNEESSSTYQGSVLSFPGSTIPDTPKESDRLAHGFSMNSISPLEAALLQWQQFETWLRGSTKHVTELGIESPSLNEAAKNLPQQHLVSGEKLTCSRNASGEEHVSEMAYQMPSLSASHTGLAGWVACVAWFIVSNLTCASVLLILMYSQTFQMLCNALFLHLTALAVLTSVIFLYPIQVAFIALCQTAHSCLHRESTFFLNCKCEKSARMLVKHFMTIHRVCKARLQGDVKVTNAAGKTAPAANYAPHPSETVLVHSRKAALHALQTARTFRYAVVCIVVTLVLLQLVRKEDIAGRYHQRTAILKAFNRNSVRKPAHDMYSQLQWIVGHIIPVLDGDKSLKLWESTGGTRVSSVLAYIQDGNSSGENAMSTTTLCGLRGCSYNMQRIPCSRLSHKSTRNVSAAAVQFVLYNPVLRCLSAVTLLVERVVGLDAQLYTGVAVSSFNPDSSWGELALKVALISIVLCQAKVIVWRVMKSKRDTLLRFWNIVDAISSTTGLCYIFCNLLHMAAFEEVSADLAQDRTKLFQSVVRLSAYEQLTRSLLGVMLFASVLNVLRVFSRYHQSNIFNCLKLEKETWKILCTLGLCWMIMLTAVSFIHHMEKRGGLLLHSVKSLQVFFHCIGIIVPFSSDPLRNTFTGFMGKLLLLVGTAVLLSSVKSTLIFEKQRHRSALKQKAPGWKCTVRTLKKEANVALGKSYYGSPAEAKTVPAEFLLLELQVLTDRVLEKANSLFPVDVKLDDRSIASVEDDHTVELNRSADYLSDGFDSFLESPDKGKGPSCSSTSPTSTFGSWGFHYGNKPCIPSPTLKRGGPRSKHRNRLSRVRRTHVMRELFIPLPSSSSSSTLGDEVSGIHRRTVSHKVRRTKRLGRGKCTQLNLGALGEGNSSVCSYEKRGVSRLSPQAL